ncbi:hypothetical protein Ae201684P_006350 [Aphanomyces euteiches]|uniref:JmjC domain-containing protein n=1 Tax=Aphanomyces euteiches TaxID=100861 RepID=A0A6G0XBD0_9STRA|nr:hypothetical protein Ae201684_006585 [Aphanomyces euteiches]KAH9090947.1 hypothetical protein Ae201684P_006350 [Aphanomyces euteiches]KAH9155616.1 hypothetical protein AeRB84_002423 [Aphanomyces euteiches]
MEMVQHHRPQLVDVARAPAPPERDPLAFLTPSLEEYQSTVVDIACAPRSDDAFSGDVRRRQSVELKFGDYVEYFQAKMAGKTHWLMDTEDELKFYLAQCPLYSTSAETPAVLPHLLTHLPPKPPCLDAIELTQVNLWMAVAPSETSLHYDAYENILHVLHGAKHVRLYPPSAVAAIEPHPVYSKSANHTTLSLADSKALPGFVDFTVAANRSEFVAGTAFYDLLSIVEALYIPEGWWHQVRSEAFTIAVNYWFNGMRAQLLGDGDMQPYYARVLLEDLIRTTRQTKMATYAAKCRLDLQQICPLNHLQDVESVVAWLESCEETMSTAILVTLEHPLLYKVSLELSERHRERWSRILDNASVHLVEHLTELWEDHDAIVRALDGLTSAEYFDKIFGCSNDAEQLQKSFLQKKDAFAAECGREVMKSMFGLSSP